MKQLKILSYKEVNKLKLNPEDNNSTSIVFNTQSISSVN